jgi:hypothetical protein
MSASRPCRNVNRSPSPARTASRCARAIMPAEISRWVTRTPRAANHRRSAPYPLLHRELSPRRQAEPRFRAPHAPYESHHQEKAPPAVPPRSVSAQDSKPLSNVFRIERHLSPATECGIAGGESSRGPWVTRLRRATIADLYRRRLKIASKIYWTPIVA